MTFPVTPLMLLGGTSTGGTIPKWSMTSKISCLFCATCCVQLASFATLVVACALPVNRFFIDQPLLAAATNEIDRIAMIKIEMYSFFILFTSFAFFL